MKSRWGLHPSGRLIATLVLGLIAGDAGVARGQVVPPYYPPATAGGVYIDADGVVRQRELDAKQLELARSRARFAASPAAAREEHLAYVSLPKLFADARALLEAGKELPEEMRYLSGLTQVRYLFVYPEEKDLVIAGPAEPWDATHALAPVGIRTGRPILQLDDLVVALRTLHQHHAARRPLGCTIDPAPDSLERTSRAMKENASASRAQRMEAMRAALGPQQVAVFGTAADTRFALACVAADFKLKRLSLGVDSPPVYGIGNAIDATRPAASRVWFELAYEPLLTTAAGDAFELRGLRLQLKAGALSFDPKGATPAAAQFAKACSQRMPQLAAAIPAFADLQGIADLCLLATLIRHDKLDERTGWDAAWLMESKPYVVTTIPVPRAAETLVNYTNGSICAGGVSMVFEPMVEADHRQVDEKSHLTSARGDATRGVAASTPK